MGNRGDARYVGALARALGGEEDPVVRATAAWSLGRIGGPAARAGRRRAAAGEADPEVRREIAEALAGAAAGAPPGPANSA
jgi:epoxyqueuosine reductase